MNKEHLEYNLRDIRKHKDIPFQLANEKLADEQFPFIKAEFSKAQMVKYDIFQYIVVTRSAWLRLIKELESIEANHKRHIVEIEKAVNHLKTADWSPEQPTTSEEIQKMFQKEEQLLAESHKRTMERHKEIMAAIDKASIQKKKPTVIGVTMSL